MDFSPQCDRPMNECRRIIAQGSLPGASGGTSLSLLGVVSVSVRVDAYIPYHLVTAFEQLFTTLRTVNLFV